MLFRLGAAVSLFCGLVYGQADFGEIRLTVNDPGGLPVTAEAEVVSQRNQYDRKFTTGAEGKATVNHLPFGDYAVTVRRSGFAPATERVEVHTTVPREVTMTLGLEQARTTVEVTGETLEDPHNYNSAIRVGSSGIQDRWTASPGRSVADIVNQQPGWVFEANGILHPRAEEYQTQYVLDGLPLTENRSVAFTPDFDVDTVQEMSIMTAGFPAEYGRKMGGVIELETQRDTRQGFHGKGMASGGSFDTAGGYLETQYGWTKTTLTLSGSEFATDRYLDPPTLQDYSNHGTVADYMAHYEADLSERDRIGIILRREQAKFLVPDEIDQWEAGQRQDRQSYEAALQFSYQHVFSPSVVGDFRAMTRDLTAELWSNPLSTPIAAGQDRGYHEDYARGTVSVNSGMHNFKFGGEIDYASIDEAFSYLVTDPTQFDEGTPLSFAFHGHAPDREQSAFAQDELHWKNLTLSGGLRFDHYDLLLNETAWSPRAGIAVYWPQAKIVFRAAYDRIFQTPAFENLLLSSSAAVGTLSDQILDLPVPPARGNYYQAGFGRAFFGHLALDGNFFWRRYHNYPDDDVLLNTGVSFPISFALANIYGAEAKLSINNWGRFSGYVSYSNERGNGYFPVTGGLFLGDDAAEAISATSGVFPVSQEERTAIRARLRCDVTKRLWVAIGGTYDSGLPIDFEGTYEDALAQYGAAIVNRINFGNFRPHPLASLNAAAGVLLSSSEKYPVRFQIDGTNLTDEINVLDFEGLFSGTALGPPRSVNARLQFGF